MNNRIRIARTDNLQGIEATDSLGIVLAKGQPFYDAETKLVFIGDGVKTIADIKADSKLAISSSNVKNTINDHNISDIFENDGVTAKTASKIVFTDVIPTEAGDEGTISIYKGIQLPVNLYDNWLYVITG